MGYVQIIKNPVGWLEGGLCSSFEKLIMEIDMLKMMSETLKSIEVS